MSRLTADEWRALARFVTRQPQEIDAELAWKAHGEFERAAEMAEWLAGQVERDPETAAATAAVFRAHSRTLPTESPRAPSSDLESKP